MTISPRSLGLLFVYIISFLVRLPAKLLALQAFVGWVRQPHLAPTHILLLSLTLADLLLLLLLLSFKMVEAANDFFWPLGDMLCALTGYGFNSGIYCSTWLLADINIEHYRSAAFPVQYKATRRPVYGAVAAVISWVLSFGHCSIVIIVQYLPTDKTVSHTTDLPVCYESFTQQQLDMGLPVSLELCLVLFFIPMGVTIFCYWRFVTIMLSKPQVGARKRWRAMGLAAVTLVNFLFCAGPFNVSHVVRFFQGQSQSWRACAVLLRALNACIDPLTFYFSSSAVCKAFDESVWRLQNWDTSLSGCWRRRIQEQALEQRDESLGMNNTNFIGD